MAKQIVHNPVAKAKRDAKLVSLLADGLTYERIGKKLGYTPGRICQLVNSDKDVAQLISESSKLQTALLPKAIEKHADILTDPETETKDRLNAIKLTYQNTGITPSNTTNIHIGQIIGQQTNTIIDPDVAKALHGLSTPTDEDTVDGEIVDI